MGNGTETGPTIEAEGLRAPREDLRLAGGSACPRTDQVLIVGSQGDLRSVEQGETSGHAWRYEVRRRATAEQDRDALARLIEHDADPFEVELYELAADPRTLLIDRAQRRRAGQYERHVRRLKRRGQRPHG
ncbi:hypothetical protein GCM10023191_078950 [Actinoallomurus oryzae]|uniref:Uncharacterized protein n=1 Tax=Actinoallomurus oryzae TaxID=502180 RepID=A0ABP8QXS6_9ACTN